MIKCNINMEKVNACVKDINLGLILKKFMKKINFFDYFYIFNKNGVKTFLK